MSGCISTQTATTPLLKAKVDAYILQAVYKDIYNQCVLYTPATPEEKKVYNEQIRPKVNTLKRLIVVYIDALQAWEAGKNDGSGLAEKKAEIDALITDIFALGVLTTK
jgi:hypothetical protein